MEINPRSVGGFLLHLIREASDNGHFPTESELLEKIRMSEGWRYWPYYSVFGDLDLILEDFKDLGLIKHAPNQEDTGFPQWEIGDSWKPPRNGDSDRNGEPPGPPNRNAGGPDDGAGGGMREVISHPLLFALDDDDFDDLVDNLFAEDDRYDR